MEAARSRPLIAAGLVLLAPAAFALATEPPGRAVYREHCVRCHGEAGEGTTAVPQPLVGDRSVNQLAAAIDETMPEDDPTRVTGAAARQVAEYIHAAFYSPVARDRTRPARVEPSRLTVRQIRETVADIVASFGDRGPPLDDRRGLRAEYFRGRDLDPGKGLVFERTDPRIDFHFGTNAPAPEGFEQQRFAVRWTGSVVPPETGTYEFVVRSEHSVKLFVNSAGGEPLVDGYVRSGADTVHRGSVFLLGGRAYPLRLDFSKANQGVDNAAREQPTEASIVLEWRPPHGVLEVVPERHLIPHTTAAVFVPTTPFPPDDRSIGYARGTTVSREWFAAATAAAGETAAYVQEHLERLSGVKRDAPDRRDRLEAFAGRFAEQAFRRPLTDDLRQRFVGRPFADAPDLDTAVQRSLLLVLGSPRFLHREPATADDPFARAARLSFGLWDSIPDPALRRAAARNELTTPDQLRAQAERMVADRRTRAKILDFLRGWLRVDHGPEITKDATRYPGFSPAITAALRESLDLLLEDAVWRDGDFRGLFTADEVWIDGRLAPLYGVDLPADADFRRVRLDAGQRAGVLTHPYLLSVFSYTGSTSPIHRGVFLARNVLGNVLRPPQEAVTPLAADQHPGLTTRERVALQTQSVACQTCHTLINPLGFALEEFDAVGRHRLTERGGDRDTPIDASGSYLPRQGPEVTFRGARELAATLVTSRDAQEAFVQNLFHALVKQPVRAWGPDRLEALRAGFAASGCGIRPLLVDIMVLAAVPPPAAESSPETTPP